MLEDLHLVLGDVGEHEAEVGLVGGAAGGGLKKVDHYTQYVLNAHEGVKYT